MNAKLKARQEARKAGCSFMSEREKGDFADLECQKLTLLDAYKLTKDGDSFWAFIVDEESEFFYFANASLSIILNDAEELAAEEGTRIADQIRGCKIYVGAEEKSKKSGRKFRPVDIVD